MNILIRTGLAVLLLLNGGLAWSACTASVNGKALNINISTLAVSNDLPNGKNITDEYTLDVSGFNYSCDSGGGGAVVTRYTRPENTQTSYSHIYATGVQGIGLKIEWPTAKYFPDRQATCQGQCSVAQNKLKFSFVKTGQISAGTISAGELGRIDVTDGSGNNRVNVFLVNLAADIHVEVKSCFAMMPSQNIDLGSYDLGTLSSGSRQGDFVDLPIKIKCPVAAKVWITFDGDVPFGQTNIIANGLSNGAKGVGVKIFRKNKITQVPINKETGINGTVPKAFSGEYTEELKAQLFVYDRSSISAGKIESFVLFTLRAN